VQTYPHLPPSPPLPQLSTECGWQWFFDPLGRVEIGSVEELLEIHRTLRHGEPYPQMVRVVREIEPKWTVVREP